MDFSPKQAEAIDAVASWLKDPAKQVFYLAGYAGTGKTTIAKHLADQQDGESLFAAYTGKAASVMQRKGMDAKTLHSLIYRLQEPDKAKVRELQEKIKKTPSAELQAELVALSQPRFILNEESELAEADLLVVDEVSMVGEQLGADLLSFGCKVLVLGDPGQLPPVDGGGFFTSKTPDYLLTEIHRQAQGNPIINMATLVRNGGRLRYGRYGNSEVFNRANAPVDPKSYDQYICGTNRTRSKLNSQLRDRLDHVGIVPAVGEKLICLRNNRDKGLLNGTQWKAELVDDAGIYLELEISNWDVEEFEKVKDAKTGEVTERRKRICVKAHQFDTDFKSMPMWDRRRAEEFDFGYAITCHKSQGSQWPHVFIVNESFCFREDANRWLYTALTRAESSVGVAL